MYILMDDMASRITKWGNSLGVRIPKPLADRAGLEEGSFVDIRLENDRLVIDRVRPPSYQLDDLLSEIRDENLHEEVFTGEPVGKEVW